MLRKVQGGDVPTIRAPRRPTSSPFRRGLTQMPRQTPVLIADMLAATAARLPDKEAIVFGERRWTWREFSAQVDNVACAFLVLSQSG